MAVLGWQGPDLASDLLYNVPKRLELRLQLWYYSKTLSMIKICC